MNEVLNANSYRQKKTIDLNEFCLFLIRISNLNDFCISSIIAL
jgi:hypothetical protein